MARRPPGQPGKLVCWFRNVLFGVSRKKAVDLCDCMCLFPCVDIAHAQPCFHVHIFQRNLNEFPWYTKVDSMSSRFVEKPNIPVANKIENNYYFQRDLVKNPLHRIYHIIITGLMYDL